MLSPGERTLLMESLRPPPGFVLDRAVGTTYSLDLLALLTAPLAFTFFTWEEGEDGIPSDPLRLLEALRRNASRITVFCQAGQIGVPQKNRPLFRYLQGSVVEATPPSPEGSFHPKTWVIRYEGEDGAVRYRLLVLTRNLTFDRSWDTVLVLEGELTNRTYAFARNHPLGDFVRSLPELAVRGLEEDAREDIIRMEDEVRRVDFELPEGFEDMQFWPIGIDGGRDWPFEGRRDRLLVVSPFTSEGLLRRLTEVGEGHLLVSRIEELENLRSSSFERFKSVYALNPEASLEDRDPEEDATARSPDVPGTGLHAKLFVAHAGWDARVWTGSANATNAAFHNNVEFLVELRGKKSRCGIEQLLGEPDDENRLRHYLKPIDPPQKPPTEDAAESILQEQLRNICRQLATLPLRAEVDETDEDVFRLRVAGPGDVELAFPSQVEIKCWPIMLPDDQAKPLDITASILADFGRCSVQAITSFFAFEVVTQAPEEDLEARSRFVLNLPLSGVPEDRLERTLSAVLDNPDEVLRFLLLLLADEALHGGDVAPPSFLPAFGDFEGGGGWDQTPLLETLLKVLDRNPARLDDVAAFLDDLRESEDGARLLPDRLDEIWRPIWQARLKLEK